MVTEQLSFTHAVLLGALVNAGLGVLTLAVIGVVTRERPRATTALGAVVATAAVALVQYLMVGDGFGRLHVAYLWLFVTLPILGGVLLLRALVPGLRPTRSGLVTGGALLALGAVGFYGTHVEPRWIRTDRVTLDVPALDGGDELRVGVLADLQTGAIGRYEHDAVDRLMAEEPDLILLAGDYFQSDGRDFMASLPELRALLARLEAPGGVFLVEGDVDSPERMAMMTEGQVGLTWLDHEVVTTEVRGHRIRIGGIPVEYWTDEAAATIAELAADPDPDELRLLLSHRPDAAGEVADDGVDLVVSGHTHGGQVQLPVLGPPITMSGVPRRVAAGGLHTLDGVPLYLSTGVGLERHNAPQVRIGARPSVGLVTLT